jgi:two-component system nitrogen regulation response regulator GlnG
MTEAILLVEDDASIAIVITAALEAEGLRVDRCDSIAGRDRLLTAHSYGLMLTDVMLTDGDGIASLPPVRAAFPRMQVIILSAQNTLDTAVRASETGAFEYFPKPFDLEELVRTVRQALGSNEAADLSGADEELGQALPLVGRSPAMQAVYRMITRVLRNDLTVLILGESGTGKELVAEAIHQLGSRREGPFVAVNTAAIPHELIESELFGHEKGAFTGAVARHVGKFEQAARGTLFLDEIGDMPADTQTRLLRVLADGEFYRVGGHTPVKVDVRIIAATHQNLETLVTAGKFREDLFHRLNVIRIHIPRLADRREDIPTLAHHFLARAAQELAVEPKLLKSETEDYLKHLPWPGNVRQLENTCRWITVMASGREVHVDDLPPELLTQPQDAAPVTNWEQALRLWADQALARGQSNLLDVAVPAFERIMIETALKHTAGRRRDAALLLGWGRNTLTRKIKELGMKVDGGDDDDGDD